jgi:hypothetical protein
MEAWAKNWLESVVRAVGAVVVVTGLNAYICTQAFDSGGIECLLAAINHHSGSAILFQIAYSALMFHDSKEKTKLLTSLGGGAKVRSKWPDDSSVQSEVRHLANAIVAEMKSWVGGEEMKAWAKDWHVWYKVGAESVVWAVGAALLVYAKICFYTPKH